MNPELPPDNRAELEAKVTALLLGELTAEEAAALRQMMSQDAALAQLQERLKATLALVRETAATSAGELSKQPAPLKLSPARREALLAHFKTIAPKEFAKPRPRVISRVVEWAAVAAILLILAGMVLPSMSGSKARSKGMSARMSLVNGRETTRFPDEPRPQVQSKGDFAARAGANLSRSVSSEGWVAAPTTANPASPPAIPPTTPIYMGKSEESGATGAAEQGVKLNLRGVTVDKALDFLSESAGLNINRQASTQVGGTVDLVSETPLTKDELVPFYNKALADNGLTAIQDNNTLNITRLEEAQNNVGTPVIVLNNSFGDIPRDSQVVTEVIPVHSLNPAQGLKDLSTPGADNPFALFFGRGRGGGGGGGGGGAASASSTYPQQGQVAPVVFNIDPISGSVIYITPDSNNEAVVQALRNLDRPKPAATVAGNAATNGWPAGAPTMGFYDDDSLNGRPAGGGVYSINGVDVVPTNRNQIYFNDGNLDLKARPLQEQIAQNGKSSSTSSQQNALVMRMQSGSQSMSSATPSANGLGGTSGLGGGGFGGGGIGGGGIGGGGGTDLGVQAPSAQPAGIPPAGLVIEGVQQGAGAGAVASSDGNTAGRARATRGGRGGARGGGRRGGGGGGGGSGGGGGFVAGVPTAASAPPTTSTPEPSLGATVLALRQARQAAENGNVAAPPANQSGSDKEALGRNSSLDSYAVTNFGTITDTKTAPATENDSKALGFYWRLGNETVNNGAVGAQAGTAPLFKGEFALANPSGIFPGAGTAGSNPGQIAPAASDSVLTGGVRKPAQAETNFGREEQAVAGSSVGEPLTRSLTFSATVPQESIQQARVAPTKPAAAAPSDVAVLGDLPVLGKLFKKEAEAAPAATPAPPTAAFRMSLQEADAAPPKPAFPPPTPQPEVPTRDNAFSTFSLNVSDVSFKLAAASLQNGSLPDASTVRSEEFINAFDYRDPEPAPSAAIGFAWERAGWPFAHNRDLLRFSVKTAAQGRQAGRPLNLVLLLDKSGSMERADRVAIIREALRVLASQLQPQDKLSVVVFARTARLWADGVSGSQAGELFDALEALTPEGGTNLEEAMRLAYEAVFRHYLANGENRVVLLTDGAANLGDVEPENLKKNVEASRTQGIALDCFGVGWEDYNDNLLEVLSRAGGGRYGFINMPEEAATGFAGQLAGALRVAASDVKVQVEFNPARVASWRQIGYAKDQLKKEQFRDNTVKAAQIGAAESGNALYTVEINPAGDGPVCTVYVRYRAPGTATYYEHAWAVPYDGAAVPLDQASPAMRLAATATAFSEWLATSPYAGGVTLDQLLGYMRGVPEIYGADARPKLLETMLREAKSITGK